MKPKIAKIVKSDWPTLAFLWGGAVTIMLYFAFPLLHKDVDRLSVFWLSFFGAGLALNILGFLWRILRFRSISSAGCIAEGRIENILFAKDRGRIEYSFTAVGRTVSSWCPVHQSAAVLSMEEGQAIKVAYTPQDPKKSFIVDLFI